MKLPEKEDYRQPYELVPKHVNGKPLLKVQGLEEFYNGFNLKLKEIGRNYPRGHKNYDVLKTLPWYRELDYESLANQTTNSLKYVTAYIAHCANMEEWNVRITTYIKEADSSLGNPFFFRQTFFQYLIFFIDNVTGIDFPDERRNMLVRSIEEIWIPQGEESSGVHPRVYMDCWKRWKKAIPDLPCFHKIKYSEDRFPPFAIKKIYEVDDTGKIFFSLMPLENFIEMLSQFTEQILEAAPDHWHNIELNKKKELWEAGARAKERVILSRKYKIKGEKDIINLFYEWLEHQKKEYREFEQLHKEEIAARKKTEKANELKSKEIFFNEQNEEVVKDALIKYQDHKYLTAICLGMADALVKANWTKSKFSDDYIARVIAIKYFEHELPERLGKRVRGGKYEKHRNEFYLKLTGNQWRK